MESKNVVPDKEYINIIGGIKAGDKETENKKPLADSLSAIDFSTDKNADKKVSTIGG